MKRVLLILAVLGNLAFVAGQAQAHEHYYYGRPHYAYYAPRVIVPPVVVGARVYAVPAPVVVPPPPVYPAPVYVAPGYGCPRYYAPAPSVGVYYRSRGLSIGIGF